MTGKLDLSRAADRALHHVEVSFRSECPPDSFAEALRTGEVSAVTRPALTLFLEKGDEETMVGLVSGGASTFATLGRLAGALLAPDHPTSIFLNGPPA